jgi:tetraacyldisaccharide 4'-kinase
MKNRPASSFLWRELISGRRRGVVAALLRGGLRMVEAPYALAMMWRNRRYDCGRKAIEKVGVPVVSVGNITLGGTGKTPLVQWIARWFRAHQVRVCIVSRGYRAEQGGLNDEARELEQNLPDVPHLQNPDRVAAALTAIEELETQLIILDDGFQHRRIARDLDVVLIDALEPFGYDHVFPRGALREPLAGLRRAGVIILSRADVLDRSQREAVRDRVRRYAPNSIWAEVRHAAKGLISTGGTGLASGTLNTDTPGTGRASGTSTNRANGTLSTGGTLQASLDSLRDMPVAAFCGLGNPAGFRHTIETCGYRLADFREYPDHHCYNRADIEDLTAWAEHLEAKAVLCTHKDLVKIGLLHLGRLPLWAVQVEIDFLTGQEALESRLLALLA